jgi:hypothetical protein
LERTSQTSRRTAEIWPAGFDDRRNFRGAAQPPIARHGDQPQLARMVQLQDLARDRGNDRGDLATDEIIPKRLRI